MESIQQAINQAIDIYTENISNKYNINKQDLVDIWNQLEPKKPPSATPTSLIKPIPTSSPPVKDTNIEKPSGCPYLFTKGAREGEACNSKPVKGEVYCSRHKKYQDVEPKVKKVIPTAKKTMAETVKPSSKQLIGKKPVNIILKKHKILDKYMDTETGFLFRSKDDRVVIGRAVDDKCIPLNENDIEEIKSRGFKFEMTTDKCLNIEDEEIEDEEIEDEDPKKDVVKPSLPKTNDIKGSDAKSVKKSISTAINNTTEPLESVEEILGMLQKKSSTGIQKKSTKDEEFASEAEDNTDEDDASIDGNSYGGDLDEEDD